MSRRRKVEVIRLPIIVRQLRQELAEDDVCPECLGDLDEGYECIKCGYDALEEIQKSRIADRVGE